MSDRPIGILDRHKRPAAPNRMRLAMRFLFVCNCPFTLLTPARFRAVTSTTRQISLSS
jgi:hypothetical protein